MLCPYCGEQMQTGEIVGDGRTSVRFRPEGKKLGFMDMLGGVGRVEAAHMSWAKFSIRADYCEKCRKMIFDTTITK